MLNTDRIFIDGAWIRPRSNAVTEVITPSTEKVFARVASAGVEDVAWAVASARAAFDTGPWPRLTHAERAEYLRAIAAEVTRRAEEFSHAWTSEVGAVHAIAAGMPLGVAKHFHAYADLAGTFEFEERRASSMVEVGLLVREPVGVVAAIIPWNGPLMTIVHKMAPALLAGCTVILKASPEAPAAAYLIADICLAIGLPRGVVNVLMADREVSEQLVRNPDVDKVSFTGSSTAGKQIGAICAQRVARCTLELGGKSAAIILDDYDVEHAASTLARSARVMSGQVCASITRVVVMKERHDAFVDALSSAFADVRVGDPFNPATEMGPLATRTQRDRVASYIALGQQEGARLTTGGKRPPALDTGYFLEPTVFAQVDNQMRIAQEEIFGPVVCVIPASTEDEAVRIANDTVFGLNASVFTQDADRAYAIARRLRSGTVGHNAMRSDFGIAFGGFKESGIGREGGREGLMAFLESKTVLLEAEPEALSNRA